VRPSEHFSFIPQQTDSAANRLWTLWCSPDTSTPLQEIRLGPFRGTLSIDSDQVWVSAFLRAFCAELRVTFLFVARPA
jgi:hypothetical protein